MNRILEIDLESQRVVVEPGVANLDVTRAVEADGFFYAPDPSTPAGVHDRRQRRRELGRRPLPEERLHGQPRHRARRSCCPTASSSSSAARRSTPTGYDLLGAFVGSEGTLGIATRDHAADPPPAGDRDARSWRRSTRATTRASAVSGVIGAGIVPAAIEMMDKLTIDAAEAAYHPGYPADAEARPARRARRDRRAGRGGRRPRSSAICRDCGAFELRIAKDDAERALLWTGPQGRVPGDGPDVARLLRAGRRRAAHAAARGAAADRRARATSTASAVGNVFHAGDGNLHPLVLYDAEQGESGARRRSSPRRSSTACLDAGGSLTGEHGVGVDKACAMPQMFSERDLETFERLRRAFDPDGIANPGKVIPTPRLCGEVPGPYRHTSAGADRACRAFLARQPRGCGSASWPRHSRADEHGRIGERPRTHGLDRVLEHEAGDLTCTVEAGDAAVGSAAALAPRGPAALARPSRRPDDRRLPRREPLRPAPAPVRRAARPRPRRHARARRRDDRRTPAARS